MHCIYIPKLEFKMAKAYSLDLRQKVMNHLDKFDNKNETSSIFNIHKDTIRNWLNRRASGRLEADKTGSTKARKIEIDNVINYLKNNRDCTLKDLAEEFNVSHVGIWEALRRNGYVFKKKHCSIEKETKSCVRYTLKK